MTTAGLCGAPEFFEREDLDLWGLLDGLSFLKCKRSLEKLLCGLLRSAWLLLLTQEAVSSRHRGPLIRLLHDTSLSQSSWGGFSCIFRVLCFWKSNTNLSSWHWNNFFVLKFLLHYLHVQWSIWSDIIQSCSDKVKIFTTICQFFVSILCSPRHSFAKKYSNRNIVKCYLEYITNNDFNMNIFYKCNFFSVCIPAILQSSVSQWSVKNSNMLIRS